MGSLNVVPSKDSRVILPVYVNTHIHDFLASFDREHLWDLFRPDRKSELYQRLYAINLARYQADLKTLDTGNPSLLSHITNRNYKISLNYLRRAFSKLTRDKSITSYAKLETDQIYAFVIQQELTEEEEGAVQFFTFTDAQKKALERLRIELERRVFDERASTEALYSLLDVVYFPAELSTTRESEFGSPFMAFIALQCLSVGGEYHSIFLIPPVLSRIQYGMRLRAWHTFEGWFGHKARDTREILDKCIEFIDLHLAHFSMSPFSTLRNWMTRFSVTSRNTPREVMVWWRGDTVAVGEQAVVDIPSYKQSLGEILKKTERLVEDEVLMRLYTMPQIEETFKVSELKEFPKSEDGLGKGILIDGTSETLDNPQSETVINEMKARGLLGLHVSAQGDLRFDRDKSLKWLASIERATERVMALSHILQGPPGRMTEESLMPLTNTVGLSRAVVFDEGEKTGAFRAGYHKGASISGYHKHILRLLPYRIFALLYVLVRLIRPIELSVLLDYCIVGDKRQAAVDAYRERVFATWGQGWSAAEMSQVLERFFLRELNVKKMNASTYRHFFVALMRRYPLMSGNAFDPTTDSKHLAKIADLMAGHTPTVAEMNYARTSNLISGIISQADCVRVCKLWHELHGIPTGMEGANDMCTEVDDMAMDVD